ncbi:universal stress protein [Natronococcus sp. A-GB7]|uniref:universal stress protein n=1 Tax=Natronococcus sp. A-GB7 TaxID=3037649 RepID=UPI00241C6B6B|nr:universal stress protein [Natronococcus sp. A-GB7]MDG5818762.1 universal stress protein [Natronococcus sp. A-GB7]
MYRVLLPIDDSEARARAQAQAVLELPRASDEITVDVLHVHEEVSGPDAEWAAGGFSEEYAEQMDENLRNRTKLPDAAEVVTALLEEGGVDYEVHESVGKPAETILAAASERDSDAIVIGIQKRSPVGKVLFGSVAQGVILDSDRPVTTVPAAEETET